MGHRIASAFSRAARRTSEEDRHEDRERKRKAAHVKVEFKTSNLGFAVVFYRPQNHTNGTVVQKYDTLNDTINDTLNAVADTLKGALSGTLNDSLSNLQKQIVSLMGAHPTMTLQQVAERTGKSRSTVIRHMDILQKKNIIRRVGSKKGGHWEIINGGKEPRS
jgi:predicted HTH transcriptional regulator